MIVYDRIYEGEDNNLAEKSYLETVSALENAKNVSRSFFFVSSSFVFDRTIGKEYTEESCPNNRTPSSLFLREAEKRVLEYQKGYVYRKQDLITDIEPMISKMIDFIGEPTFCEESVRILSDKVFSDVMSYAVTQNFGDNKVFHIASPTKFMIYDIWFSLRGTSFSINEREPDFVFKKNVGYISSKILKRLPFYQKILMRNSSEVLNYLNNRKRDEFNDGATTS